MYKKLLFGIILVVGIIGALSFVSVVGYQLVTSSSIAGSSPLFMVRTNQALGKHDMKLECRFDCKDVVLPFPRSDGRVVVTQQIIESIRRMDEGEFERFVVSVITCVQKDDMVKHLKPSFIREVCYVFRDSEKSLLVGVGDSVNMTFAFGVEGFLSCLLLPFILVVMFCVWCLNPGSTMIVTCPTMHCPQTLARIFSDSYF